jgi:hypothetical protein
MLRSSSKLLPRFAYGLPRSPNPALEKPKDCSVTPLNLDRFVWCCRNNFIQFMAQNRNIWVDMARTTLYLVARLLVTFPGGASKGNPVRIRNCPAAVSRIEHPIATGFL